MKRLGYFSLVAAILTICITVLIYTSSSLTNSKAALNQMINQQVIERKLKEQNESYYNRLEERIKRTKRNLDDYQTGTNSQMGSLRRRMTTLEEELNTLSEDIQEQQGE